MVPAGWALIFYAGSQQRQEKTQPHLTLTRCPLRSGHITFVCISISLKEEPPALIKGIASIFGIIGIFVNISPVDLNYVEINSKLVLGRKLASML